MTRRSVAAIPLVCGLLLWSLPAMAQTTDARLGGTVTDPSGALIPGVEVTAENVATGVAPVTITNETGTYQFTNLQTGTYEVRAELPGFQQARYTDIVLGASQQVRLNITLQLGAVTTAVEVSAAETSLLTTTSSSVFTTLPEAQVRDLPLGNRDVLQLLGTMAGTGPTESDVDGNFSGNRLSAVNITRDGMPVSAGRYDQGTLSVTYMSPDLVEEVRVTTGAVDAESGRGAGQVQMVTRSGTNEFRGSAFWNNQNSSLEAANWFNNFNGVPGDYRNRNQFGVRLGGPIIPDKTFFFFLVDEQRTIVREDFVGTVLTDQARQGQFRFFPGADNRNALQNDPTVDLDGNPVMPAGATGPLETIDLYSLDPQRTTIDQSGWVQNELLSRMPSPNDFTVGDGLNTAGIRFTRRINGRDTNVQELVEDNNRDQFNLRIDHNFTPSNRASYIYTWERSKNQSAAQGLTEWPGGYDGSNEKYPRVHNFSLVSTVSANVVNEFRVGYRQHDVRAWAPWYVGRNRDDVTSMTDEAIEAFLTWPQYNASGLTAKNPPVNGPVADGIPLQIDPSLLGDGFINFDGSFGSTRGSVSPMWTFNDTISFIRGEHAFKAGFEMRRDSTEGYNDNNFTPLATIGDGSQPAPISSLTVPGLSASPAGTARDILYVLSGSIDRVNQGYDLRSPTQQQFTGYQDGTVIKVRNWHANEITTFFKDEWKVTQDLTLNLGVTWEWYGVPYGGTGLAAKVIGGIDGLCGIGCTGELTQLEFVGKNSPNPDRQLFDDDWNNFAPAVGFSWALPGFDKPTTLRGGYGISYVGRQIVNAMSAGGLDSMAGTLPGAAGINGCCGQEFRSPTLLNLANVTLPFASAFGPLDPVPLDGTRALTMNTYEQDRRTPYIQNFNLSIQRELFDGLVLDVAYVGSKGTKLYNRLPLSQSKIMASFNGETFLDAVNTTREGGDSPMFDAMLDGLDFGGTIGVVGVDTSGSSALRRYTSTRADLARGEAGTIADFINRSTNLTGVGGGILGNSGLFPEDFLTFNPQFREVGLNGNNANSTYHSLQIKVTKRLSNGFTNQTSYVWSRSIGISDSDQNLFTRDPDNRSIDKGLLGFHRSHIFTSNGTYQLPFGAGRQYLSAAPDWVDGLVGGWQLGGIFRYSTGAPLTLMAGGLSNIWQTANNTPNAFGALPDPEITFGDGTLPTYFPGVTQSTDRTGVTTVDSLHLATNNRAIFDGSGNMLLANPVPGEAGNVGISTIEGPGLLALDMNLAKEVRIDENRNVEIRADVTNLLNHPVFGNPNTNINSSSFGRISSASGGRRFLLGLRLNF